MATLTATELAELRQQIEREWITDIDFNKSVANAALQSLEDWYEGERATVSGLMDTATTPKTFTGAEKKLIAKSYLKWKFEQGG